MDASSKDVRDRVLRALERGDRPTAIATDLKSVEFESIRYGRVSRRRDSVAVYRWVATSGHGWLGWSRGCEPG